MTEPAHEMTDEEKEMMNVMGFYAFSTTKVSNNVLVLVVSSVEFPASRESIRTPHFLEWGRHTPFSIITILPNLVDMISVVKV